MTSSRACKRLPVLIVDEGTTTCWSTKRNLLFIAWRLPV